MGQYRRYFCRKDRGGCGQRFSASKSETSKLKVVCPACGSYGGKKKKDGTYVIEIEPMVPRETHFRCNRPTCNKWWWQRVAEDKERDVYCPRCKAKGTDDIILDGEKRPMIEAIGIRAPGQMKDVDSYDGKVHEDVPMPAFGPNATISSRSQLKELQEKAREITWKRTTGDKSHMVRDPETGKIEKVTVKGKEIDIGEVHTLEKRPEPLSPEKAIKDVREQIRKEREGK